MEPGQERCFKDEVVKNYTLEMVINVLDNEVVDNYKQNLQKQIDGVQLSIFNQESEQLYSGVVWPNDQYEYDADRSGEYTVCV